MSCQPGRSQVPAGASIGTSLKSLAPARGELFLFAVLILAY